MAHTGSTVAPDPAAGGSDDRSPVEASTAGRSPRRWLAYGLAAAVLVVLGLLLFQVSGRDDAYLTYWPADQLAQRGEILNYNGERIEQSSSLLHVVVLAALVRTTGVATTDLGWILGIVAGAGAVVLAGVLGDRVRDGWGWAAALLAALSAPLVYWSFSGLETSLAALTLTGVVAVTAAVLEGQRVGTGRWVGAAVVIASYLTVRPEAGLVTLAALAATGLLLWWRGHRDLVPRVGGLLAITAGLFAVVLAFRLAYFGAAFPQPVSAKTGLDVATVESGARYLARTSLAGFGLLIALGTVGAVLAVRARHVVGMVATATAVAGLAFVVTAGGDWMETGRMVAPVVPALAALGAGALGAVGSARWRAVAVGGTLALLLLDLGRVAAVESTGVPLAASTEIEGQLERPWAPRELNNRVQLRDADFLEDVEPVVARLLDDRSEPLTIASSQAGMVIYTLASEFPDRLRWIDLGSLSTDTMDACPEVLEAPSSGGTLVDERAWYDLQPVCGVEPPELVFILGSPTADQTEHYTPVVALRGPIEVDGVPLPGRNVSNGQTLLVRNDVAARAGLT